MATFNGTVRARRDNVYLDAPIFHLLPSVTGGLQQMIQNIQGGTIPAIQECGYHTDKNGQFRPRGKCIIGMRYDVKKTLSNKGHSAVLVLAEDLYSGKRHVVIKVLHADLYRLGSMESQILWRLAVADPLNHSHTIRLLNTVSFDYHFCLVFEPLLPDPITKVFQRIPGHQVLSSLRKVFLRLLASVGFLHQQNLIHSDLKPDNILLKHEHDLDSVHIVDFGNAIHCVHQELSLYYSDFELQTPLYRAPEVMFGLPFGTEIDMWSLGCTLAEMYKGTPLFMGTTKTEIVHQMEKVLGPMPTRLFQRGKFFTELKQYTADIVQPDATLKLINQFECPDFSLCSLLSGLLKYNPDERLTAFEAAQHPFFAAHFPLSFLMPHRPGTQTGHDGVEVTQQAYTFHPDIPSETKKKRLSSLELLHFGTHRDNNDIKHKKIAIERPIPWKQSRTQFSANSTFTVQDGCRLQNSLDEKSAGNDIKSELPDKQEIRSHASTIQHQGESRRQSSSSDFSADGKKSSLASLMQKINAEQNRVERDLERKELEKEFDEHVKKFKPSSDLAKPDGSKLMKKSPQRPSPKYTRHGPDKFAQSNCTGKTVHLSETVGRHSARVKQEIKILSIDPSPVKGSSKKDVAGLRTNERKPERETDSVAIHQPRMSHVDFQPQRSSTAVNKKAVETIQVKPFRVSQTYRQELCCPNKGQVSEFTHQDSNVGHSDTVASSETSNNSNNSVELNFGQYNLALSIEKEEGKNDLETSDCINLPLIRNRKRISPQVRNKTESSSSFDRGREKVDLQEPASQPASRHLQLASTFDSNSGRVGSPSTKANQPYPRSPFLERGKQATKPRNPRQTESLRMSKRSPAEEQNDLQAAFANNRRRRSAQMIEKHCESHTGSVGSVVSDLEGRFISRCKKSREETSAYNSEQIRAASLSAEREQQQHSLPLSEEFCNTTRTMENDLTSSGRDKERFRSQLKDVSEGRVRETQYGYPHLMKTDLINRRSKSFTSSEYGEGSSCANLSDSDVCGLEDNFSSRRIERGEEVSASNFEQANATFLAAERDQHHRLLSSRETRNEKSDDTMRGNTIGETDLDLSENCKESFKKERNYQRSDIQDGGTQRQKTDVVTMAKSLKRTASSDHCVRSDRVKSNERSTSIPDSGNSDLSSTSKGRLSMSKPRQNVIPVMQYCSNADSRIENASVNNTDNIGNMVPNFQNHEAASPMKVKARPLSMPHVDPLSPYQINYLNESSDEYDSETDMITLSHTTGNRAPAQVAVHSEDVNTHTRLTSPSETTRVRQKDGRQINNTIPSQEKRFMKRNFSPRQSASYNVKPVRQSEQGANTLTTKRHIKIVNNFPAFQSAGDASVSNSKTEISQQTEERNQQSKKRKALPLTEPVHGTKLIKYSPAQQIEKGFSIPSVAKDTADPRDQYSFTGTPGAISRPTKEFEERILQKKNQHKKRSRRSLFSMEEDSDSH